MSWIRRTSAGVLTLAALAGCGGGAIAPERGAAPPATTRPIVMSRSGDRVPIIVDYSPTLSDVTALLFLAVHPGVDLRAVTLAGTGESRCAAAVPNTLALLARVGRPDVPVACGQAWPIASGNSWPDEWRDAADELPGLDLSDPATAGASDIEAGDLLAQSAASAPGAIVVALGPLTNLAAAIERHPSFVDDVAMVYTMGGALDVGGNAPNGTAEWNYYVDPAAVDVVVRSGVPLTLVPLDATDEVPVEQSWVETLGEHRSTPAADAVYDLFTAGRPWENGFHFWDELTAAIAVDESLATIDAATIEVTTVGVDAGRTTRSAGGSPVRLATAPDRVRFESGLLATLNAPGVAPGA